ncbi:aspartate aminotransferase family protein, partial [Dickeya dadantii]|nr:aspartate aminotransferase family protein [Dickeya dadantii]
MSELTLLADADERGRRYLAGNAQRRVFPDADALSALARFNEALPQQGFSPEDTLTLLDEVGSPATTASNGP